MINSPRIQEITRQVTAKVIAEIGCDHAYITKNLFDTKKIDFAFVTDISAKCLEKAKTNLKNYEQKTIFSIGNGLKALKTESYKGAEIKNCSNSPKTSQKPEQIIIAGMGGFEIIKILSGIEAKNYDNFILQPQKNVVEVRTYLQNNSFRIVKDEIVQEDKMFYFVINAIRTTKNYPINTNELYFGFTQNREVLKNYLNFKLQKCLEISKKVKTIENETLIRLINSYLENLK